MAENFSVVASEDVGTAPLVGVPESGSGSVRPVDSVSERGVQPLVNACGLSDQAARVLEGYYGFMGKALELSVGVEESRLGGVRHIVETCASVVNGYVAASAASGAGGAVSINCGASGVSVRSGSWSSASSRSSSRLFKSGAASVALRGKAVPVSGLSCSSAYGPGSCYLRFVAKGCRTAARKCLGQWPTVESLLRSPAQLYDRGLMDSCEFVQTAPGMYHVQSSAGSSYQLAVRASLARTVASLGSAGREYVEGTLGDMLVKQGCSYSAAPALSVSARVGGGGEGDLRSYDVPAADWSWSKQSRWCASRGYCSGYWRYGVCSLGSCRYSHVRISGSRLADPSFPAVGWSKSQKIKWCANSRLCWRMVYFGACDRGDDCDVSHVVPRGLSARFSAVYDAELSSSASSLSSVGDDFDVRSLEREGDALSLVVEKLSSAVGERGGRAGSSAAAFCYHSDCVTDVMSLDVDVRVLPGGCKVPRSLEVRSSCGAVVYRVGVDMDCSFFSGSSESGFVSYYEARRVLCSLFSTSVLDVASSRNHDVFFAPVRVV